MNVTRFSLVRSLIVLLVCSVANCNAAGPPDWELQSGSFASGGHMSGGDWDVIGNLGQSLSGNASGGDWDVSGGFKPGNVTAPECPGDVNGSGFVDVTDLLAVLGAWGPCTSCDADLDGNGAVDVSDLLTVLANWGECALP